MVGGLVVAVIAVALGLAAWAGVSAARDRLPPRQHLQGLFVLQALIAVQAVVALVRAGDWAGSKPELFGYLAAWFVLVPGGLALVVEERSRYGTLVLAVACLTVAVVAVRLGAVWDGGVTSA